MKPDFTGQLFRPPHATCCGQFDTIERTQDLFSVVSHAVEPGLKRSLKEAAAARTLPADSGNFPSMDIDLQMLPASAVF